MNLVFPTSEERLLDGITPIKSAPKNGCIYTNSIQSLTLLDQYLSKNPD